MTTPQQRLEIVREVGALVSTKHVDPSNMNADYVKWQDALQEKAKAFCSGSDSDFERGLSGGLAELGTSHLSLLLPGSSSIPPTFALNAGLMNIEKGSGRHWMFRDVVEDGPAHRAGIKDGELLLAIDGQSLQPPQPVLLTLGRQYDLTLGRYAGGETRSVQVDLPAGSAKGRPPGVEPKAVTFRDLGNGIAHLRVSYFPGAVGYGFIKDLNTAIEKLTSTGARHFVLDLRGNPGGGLGSLRLMSLLASEPTPVGYSLTRKAINKRWKRDQLPRINRIPVGKLEQIMMAIRFKVLNRDRSISMATEPLPHSPLAGATVLLVNSHTRSAAEMIAAFVKEQGLAPIVGEKTPGEVLGAVNFRLPHGYRLRMPIATWQTWVGGVIEGIGVEPDYPVLLDAARLAEGIDNQLQRAIALCSDISIAHRA
jgi:C-terminal processing protease CtpA/Prc